MADLLRQQLDLYKQFLRQSKFDPDSSLKTEVRDFIEKFPGQISEEELAEIRALIGKAFGEIPTPVSSKVRSTLFDALVPQRGWFRDYHTYTLLSEPPAVFHFTCALACLGASLQRNVFFDKGYYKIYPNIAVVLIAPTGKCRKTSATNVALSLARAVNVNVLSERVTPEALVSGLAGRETASGLVYAPELAVFLGRQKYLEGMVPLLTSLFDCPDEWKSTTIGRGALQLKGVAVSMLAASTLEWFVEALPREAFSGGFMARLLFVIQEDTPREFALPQRPEGHLWERLREDLQEMMLLQGEVTLDPTARVWYESWYKGHHHSPMSDERFAGYHERKPDHLLRLAMLLRIASAKSLVILNEDFQQALKILEWLEGHLPQAFAAMVATPTGALHERILRVLEENGGMMRHSALLRRHQHLMNAREFNIAIQTLIDSECVVQHKSRTDRSYELVRRR